MLCPSVNYWLVPNSEVEGASFKFPMGYSVSYALKLNSLVKCWLPISVRVLQRP